MKTPTTEIREYDGEKYAFKLICDPADGYFEMVATHKGSKRQSSVTNLNYVINEVLGRVLDAKEIDDMTDSWLHVKDMEKFKKLVAAAKKFLKRIDPDFESALDEDMKEGGWNSRGDAFVDR